MPNPNHRLLAKMYRRAHWLPEEMLLEVYRNAHEMCLSEVKREMLHVTTKCTCNITMGGHALIDRYDFVILNIDIWRDAHYAEEAGLHCFHVEHCNESTATSTRGGTTNNASAAQVGRRACALAGSPWGTSGSATGPCGPARWSSGHRSRRSSVVGAPWSCGW